MCVVYWSGIPAETVSFVVPSDARFELGRPPANTKLSPHVTVRTVRTRGGNTKFRALRLDHGNFSWGSEVRHIYLSL
jgi:ribosomal protein S8E